MRFEASTMIAFTIVAAMCLQVVAAWSSIMCDELDYDMRHHRESAKLLSDPDLAFNFAKNWITDHKSLFSVDRKVIKAWKHITKDGCSAESWDHLLVLSRCKDENVLSILDEPLKSYATRCLGPEYVSQKIKAGTSGLISFDVKFIDAEFVKKFYEDNPNDIPLHVNWIGDDYWVSYHRRHRAPRRDPDKNCCRAERSFGAVIDAIKRNLAKHGKDAKSEFYKKPQALHSYLDKKLYYPCGIFESVYSNLAWELAVVSRYYEGRQQALIKTLNQDAKDILFRFKYCEMIKRDKGILEKGLRKELVD